MRGVPANGEFLKARRRELGLTQEKLAAKADCDVRTVRNAERGSNVDIVTLKQIAVALEVKFSQAASTGQPSTQANLECIEKWQTAFFARDIETLVQTYADEGVMQLPSAALVRGRVALTAAFQQAFEGFSFEALGEAKLTAEGERVFLESGLVRVTSLGDNTQLDTAAVHVFELENAHIVQHVAFYDALPFAN